MHRKSSILLNILGGEIPDAWKITIQISLVNISNNAAELSTIKGMILLGTNNIWELFLQVN